VGLAVPSLNPSRFRDVPDGRGGELYPAIFQRSCIAPRAAKPQSADPRAGHPQAAHPRVAHPRAAKPQTAHLRTGHPRT